MEILTFLFMILLVVLGLYGSMRIVSFPAEVASRMLSDIEKKKKRGAE